MSLRDYQIKANAAILSELESNDACLVKMFCGTGKTKIMVEGDINKEKNLILYVFPSLQLIEQFDGDYLSKVDPNLKIRVCSDSDDISNTNIEAIVAFLNLEIDELKYVLTTYQSLNTCYEAMDLANVVADVTHFDEAHHCTADTYQKLIFGEDTDGTMNSRFSNKQIFLAGLIREMVLVPGAVVGLTVSLRNPDGSGFVNQDVSELTALMYSTFNVGVNVVQENSMDGACMYVYGKCTRMATAIIQIGTPQTALVSV